jgi:flavin reductase (DIM6/NTAB) family NADH-FMN oxidoreductase RutF
MEFDMRELPLAQRYKILGSTITPRPIAWVTSISASGVINAAPLSFFNCVGVEPPLIVLGLLRDLQTGRMKDTATNLHETGEFTVNLVCEGDGPVMNESSAAAPPDVSEVDYAGLITAPSRFIVPPRIATSPVSFECKVHQLTDVGMQTVVLGEVLAAHIADEFISDREKLYFDTPAMKLIGRTHGAGWYVRNSDSFLMERPAYDPERLAGD